MDLFLAAGVNSDPGGPGRAGRGAPSIRRTALFNPKVVEDAARLAAFNPTPEQLAAAKRFADTARNPNFAKQKETAVRNLFYDDILCTLLGFAKYAPEAPYTLAFERPIRGGAVDVALGHFRDNGDEEVVAPFEMKGPGTVDLDAILPGRGRSPVQQAWDYAVDAPGSRWVLVSNCVEIRLYGFGRGRDAYELFDLREIDNLEKHRRLWLLLSSARLLGDATLALLRETDSAYKAITNEFYVGYNDLRRRLIGFLVDSIDGPRLPRLRGIEVAQKVLDRILFIAFAQRTDLLADGLLKRAAQARTAFDRKPTWHYIANLFSYLNEGHHDLDITAYNGGLFAHDPVADSVIIPEKLTEELVALGEWDYRRDVPVAVLGHIFEQSITDIEKERAESEGKPAPKVSKRKREGVVYTPDIVTRFLVERTVGVVLGERFSALLLEHAGIATLPRNGDRIPWKKKEASERAFWSEYLAAIRSLTIVDPACGSGAFLVAAFDVLAAEYARVADRLAALGQAIDFDPMDEIVTRNLHGVDLNAESVEITRLSIWLKTARRKHRLQNLESNIKVGDSLIDDPKFSARPFDWRAAFPQVFATGGFDVVIGNPPYVRMELIKAIKPYLAEHYTVAADRTDLYAYFFEKGVRILKDGGRLGYISSSTFFRTGSGENLRTFLGDGVAVETVVDFGDLQLFEGVTTYPAILTLKKETAPYGTLSFLKVEDELPKDLGIAFDLRASKMPRSRLGAGSWRLEEDALARLRDKIAAGRKTLGEVYGPPLYGIKTGLNEAFIVDTTTRDRLVATDAKSDELLKPFLRGENVKRWRVETEGLFLINTPKGKVDIDRYPAIRDWLLPFRPELEKRATKQEWFELQQAQLAYQPRMLGAKIIWPHFQLQRAFAAEASGLLLNNKCFFLATGDGHLLSVLNSTAVWFQLASIARLKRGGYLEAEAQYVAMVSVPQSPTGPRKRLSELGMEASEAAKHRLEVQSAVRHRIADLAVPERRKLSAKLSDWWTLDFAAFRGEVTKTFRNDIPVNERDAWERYLAENAAEVKALTAKIEDAEREIDRIVYGLFDLTQDEIKLLEASIEGQH